MPAPFAVGLNVDGPDAYDVSPFADLMRSCGVWDSPDSAPPDVATMPVRPLDGLPAGLRPGQRADLGAATDYEAGEHKVAAIGKGRLHFVWLEDGEFRDAKLDFPGAPTTLAFTVGTGKVTSSGLTIEASDPGDNLRGLSRFGPADGPGKVFAKRHVDQIRPFAASGPLRFLNYLRANKNPISDWSGRPPVQRYTWRSNPSAGFYGCPPETAIELIRETGAKSWWLNVPHRATPDYVKQLATMMRDGTPPGTVGYLEYSNETWNGTFRSDAGDSPEGGQYTYCRAKGKERYPAVDETTASNAFAVDRAEEIYWSFAEVYGHRASEIRPVLATLSVVPDWQAAMLDRWAAASHPVKPILAIGGYVTIEPATYRLILDHVWTPEQVVAHMAHDRLAGTVNDVAKAVALAKSRGSEVWVYETNLDWVVPFFYRKPDGTDATFTQAEREALDLIGHAALALPAAGKLLADLLAGIRDAGAAGACIFSQCGRDTNSGAYGLWKSTGQPLDGTERGKAALAFIGHQVTPTPVDPPPGPPVEPPPPAPPPAPDPTAEVVRRLDAVMGELAVVKDGLAAVKADTGEVRGFVDQLRGIVAATPKGNA